MVYRGNHAKKVSVELKEKVCRRAGKQDGALLSTDTKKDDRVLKDDERSSNIRNSWEKGKAYRVELVWNSKFKKWWQTKVTIQEKSNELKKN